MSILHEEEILILGLRDRVGREVHARVAAVGAVATVFDDAGVRTEAVVDEAAAGRAIGELVRSGEFLRDGVPALIEELRVLERAVVRVVRAARVADINVGTPSDAVEDVAVAIAAHGTRHVRAVRVVHPHLPFAAHRNFAVRRVDAVIRGVLRIAVARGAVGLIVDLNGMETIAVEIGVLVEQSARVHDAHRDAGTVVAERVGG